MTHRYTSYNCTHFCFSDVKFLDTQREIPKQVMLQQQQQQQQQQHFENKEIQTEVSNTNNFHSFVKRNSCCAVQHGDLVLDWTKDGEISASPP